jgi:nucleoside-diphosphate-sugar epimerase
MRIALIGGAGFVGTRVAQRAALTGGVEAVAVIRSFGGLSRLSRSGTPYRIGDASDARSLAGALEGMDAVVNLTMGNNARILADTQVIWETCRAARIPLLVHLSSAAIHGRAEQHNLTDDSPPEYEFWDAYANAKWRADTWLRKRIGKGGPRIVVLRPGLIWGPGSGWVVNPVEAILAGTACLIDGGKWICNLIYIDNLAECILAVAKAGGRFEGVFNVADREEVTWREYYSALAQSAGIGEPCFHSMAEAEFCEPLQLRIWKATQHPTAKMLKRCIPLKTKTAVKACLKVLLTRPRPPERVVSVAPTMDKSTWWLQTTRRRLPTAKYQAAYGAMTTMVPFREAMARTGRWMRFAGFTAGDGTAQ